MCIKYFSIFVVRDTLKVNSNDKNFTTKKTEQNNRGSVLVQVHSLFRCLSFDVSRSDYPFLFNSNLFIMRDTKRQSNANSVQQSATIQLPVSNNHGIPILADFLAEVQRRFDVEKNIKNNLYAFILEKGLFNELREYERTHNMSSPDGHARAVAGVALNVLPEFKN